MANERFYKTFEERIATGKRAYELRQAGRNYAEIATIMNKEGFRKPNGARLDKKFLPNQYHCYRQRIGETPNRNSVKMISPEDAAKLVKPKAKTKSLDDKMLDVIMGTDKLTNTEKVDAIKAYF